MTRCTVEDSGGFGVYVYGERGTAELVDCVSRKNGGDGVRAFITKVMLRGDTICENGEDGVSTDGPAKIRVASAEEGKAQTVSENNGQNPDAEPTDSASWQRHGQRHRGLRQGRNRPEAYTGCARDHEAASEWIALDLKTLPGG